MKKEILLQLDIAWQLFEYHCHNLSEEEAMWCKTNQGLQIRKVNAKHMGTVLCVICFMI